MDPVVVTTLQQLRNDMQSALKLYDDRCPPAEESAPPVVPEIQKLCAIAHKEITNMQLGFSGETVPAAEELVVETSRSLNALLVLGWQSTANAGDVLFRVIKDHANEVVVAVCCFIDAILAKQGDEEFDKRFVGMVWEKLDAWKNLKLQNRTHITLKLQMNLGMIKDARMELRGEIDSYAQEENGQNGAPLALMEQVWSLVGVTIDICKRLAIAAVVKRQEPSNLEEVAAMEWPLQAVDDLSESVDDLVIALGPPPDSEEVAEALPEMIGKVEALVAHVKGMDETVDDLDKLAESLHEHKQQIQDLIRDL